MNNILNITNGESFNEHFLLNYGGNALPFCEDMMDGSTVSDIYSEEFIALRAKELSVSIQEYKAKMYVYEALKDNNYSELRLWFGKDTFCQVNLLTLLAYLEQISFDGKVILNYIDDETYEIIEANIYVSLGLYKKMYEEILAAGQAPCEIGVLCPEAVALYFDYHSDDGFLSRLARENINMDKISLICLLLENSKDYGLSDLQAERIIDRYKRNTQ